MNIKKGFELRDVCGEKVIIASGLENLDFTKLISVNETGADIWNLLLEGATTEEELMAKVLEMYEGDEAQMRGESAEISRTVRSLLKKGSGYSLAVALAIFIFADRLGIAVYSSPEAGHFLRLLAPLIPIMYTDMLCDGCLKGLGQQMWNMGINVLDALLGVLLVWRVLPVYALTGYICIIYFNECLNFALSMLRLGKVIRS